MTPREARVRAQAKLNLYLRVSEPDGTGYHPLETLFCRIQLADVVTVAIHPHKTLDVFGPRVPAGGLGHVEQNLAWRAAEAYAGAAGFPDGFSIQIEKHIPVGGGLGGGSADAGAVLRALDALNPDPLGPERLVQVAVSLGADVPFLTQDTSPLAFGRGYGERLEILAPLPSRPAWLLIPDVSVSTPSAYRWLDERARATLRQGPPADLAASWESVARNATNDFESAVAEKVPLIGRLLAGFRSPAFADVLGDDAVVLMSGSGSTVAIIAGHVAKNHWAALPPVAGVDIVETETAAFVEPVVRTH